MVRSSEEIAIIDSKVNIIKPCLLPVSSSYYIPLHFHFHLLVGNRSYIIIFHGAWHDLDKVKSRISGYINESLKMLHVEFQFYPIGYMEVKPLSIPARQRGELNFFPSHSIKEEERVK